MLLNARIILHPSAKQYPQVSLVGLENKRWFLEGHSHEIILHLFPPIYHSSLWPEASWKARWKSCDVLWIDRNSSLQLLHRSSRQSYTAWTFVGIQGPAWFALLLAAGSCCQALGAKQNLNVRKIPSSYEHEVSSRAPWCYYIIVIYNYCIIQSRLNVPLMSWFNDFCPCLSAFGWASCCGHLNAHVDLPLRSP